jgi:hypothetical protein
VGLAAAAPSPTGQHEGGIIATSFMRWVDGSAPSGSAATASAAPNGGGHAACSVSSRSVSRVTDWIMVRMRL